jgi:1,4-alpha-glucan branching enzyme
MKNHLIIRIIIFAFIAGCAGLAATAPDAELHEVEFYFEGKAESVCITGDFNQWTPDRHCLTQKQGTWFIRMHLPHGPCHYAFVVDGRAWVMDPRALFVENDGFGKQNSVIMVE